MGEPEIEGSITSDEGTETWEADTGISVILLAVGYNL
jgi:hypothetical protein